MRALGGMTVVVAGLAFVAAAALFGSTVLDAVRVEEPDAGRLASERLADPGAADQALSRDGWEAAAQPQAASLRGTPYPNVTANEILTTVNMDLFQPDRTAPEGRYLLPSERVPPAPAQEPDRRQRGPEFRIVGVAMMGDLALALVQVEDTLPVAVLLGESIQGYTLASVDAESATLVGANGMLTLPVMEPLRARERSSERNQNARGNQNSRGDQNNAQAAEALRAAQQRFMQMQMQRGQGGGGDVMLRMTPNVIVRPRGGGGGGERP